MGYKMKGSPAKLGTIQGTTGHTSALKMASSPAPFIGKVVGAIGKAAGVVSKITGGAGKIGAMASKVSKGAETAGKVVKKGKDYLSKAKAKRASRVKKYDVGGKGKADSGKKKAIFPEDRLAGSPAKMHRPGHAPPKDSKYRKDIKRTSPDKKKRPHLYDDRPDKKDPRKDTYVGPRSKGGLKPLTKKDKKQAKPNFKGVKEGSQAGLRMGGMKGKKSPAKIGGLGGLILKGAMKKVGKKVGKVTELAKSMPAPEASPAKMHKKGKNDTKAKAIAHNNKIKNAKGYKGTPYEQYAQKMKVKKREPLTAASDNTRVARGKPIKISKKTPSKWIGTAIKVVGKGLAGRAASQQARDDAKNKGVQQAMGRGSAVSKY